MKKECPALPSFQSLSSLLTCLIAILVVALAPTSLSALEISGRVVQAEDGSPMRGATISLLGYLSQAEIAERFLESPDFEDVLRSSQSDADGFYSLQAPGAGVYTVLVEAKGFRPLAFRLTPLLENKTLSTARLAPARLIRLKLLDDSGQPLAEVRGELIGKANQRTRRQRRGRDLWWPYPARAWSDPEGQIVLVAGEDEKLGLGLSAPGQAIFLDPAFEGGSKIHLAEGFVMDLLVVDEEDRPLPGVVVRRDRLPLGRTDEEGHLNVHLGEDSLHINADFEDRRGHILLEKPNPASATEEAKPRATLRLEPVTKISGVVIDELARQPIAGAWVWPSRQTHLAHQTDASGTYHLPADESWVMAAATGYRSGRGSITEGAESAPTIVLKPASSLIGRLLDAAGEPIEEARITFSTLGQGRRSRGVSNDATSMADGTFRASGLPVDSGLEMRVEAFGFITEKLGIEALAATETRDLGELRLDPALVAVGRVVNEDDKGIEGASVELSEQPKSADFRKIFQRMRNVPEPPRATTNKEGFFRLENLDPATYRLRATVAGFAPAKVPGLEIVEGAGEVDLGTVVLVPGVEIRGRVTDADGKALAEVKVSARVDNRDVASMIEGMSAEPLEATTGSDGRFALEDLLPSQALSVGLEKEGYAADAASVVSPSAEEGQKSVTLAMEIAARLVVDIRQNDGQPIERAMVMVKKPGGGFTSPKRGISEADGRAEVDALVPGRFDVEITAEGFRPFKRAGLEVGTQDEPIEVVLERGLKLSGTVFDPNGAPLSEAFIRLEQAPRSFSFGRQHASSDGDGRFVLEGLEAGAQVLAVRHSEWGNLSKRVEVGGGVTDIEIRFGGGTEVSGQVIDAATGEAVAGAEIQLRAGAAGNPFGTRTPNAASDENGRFTIKNVPTGTYQTQTSHDDYASISGESFEVGELAVDNLVIELTGGESIVGQVIGVDFDQLSETSLMALSPHGGFVHATVDFEGRFRIERLAPGDWVIRASVPGGRQATERVQLEAGDGEVEIEIEIGGGFKIRGQVTRSGVPSPGMRVSASQRTLAVFVEDTTDSDGLFTLEGLEAGTYDVRVESKGRRVMRTEKIEVDGDDEWSFDLQGAQLAGRVSSQGGEALVDVVLILRSESGETSGLEASPFGSNRVTTDSLGRFDFGEVASGTYRLVAQKKGFAQVEELLEIATAPRTDLDLILERTSGVTLRPVRSAGGRPARVDISIFNGEQRLDSRTETLDEDGVVRLETLPAGSFTLLIAEPGGPTLEKSIESPGDIGTLQLPRGGLLIVEMPELFADGVSADIKIHRADDSEYRPAGESGRWTNWLRGSEYRRALPAGTYSLKITAEDGRAWEYPATISDGGETTLRVP